MEQVQSCVPWKSKSRRDDQMKCGEQESQSGFSSNFNCHFFSSRQTLVDAECPLLRANSFVSPFKGVLYLPCDDGHKVLNLDRRAVGGQH